MTRMTSSRHMKVKVKEKELMLCMNDLALYIMTNSDAMYSMILG
jgi:hypothetical protein